MGIELYRGKKLYCKNGETVTVVDVNEPDSTMILKYKNKYYRRSIRKSINITLFEHPYTEYEFSTKNGNYTISSVDQMFFQCDGMALPLKIEKFPSSNDNFVTINYAGTPRPIHQSHIGRTIFKYDDLSSSAKQYLYVKDSYYKIIYDHDYMDYDDMPDDLARLSQILSSNFVHLCNKIYSYTVSKAPYSDYRIQESREYDDSDYLSTGKGDGYYDDWIDIDAAVKNVEKYAAH